MAFEPINLVQKKRAQALGTPVRTLLYASSQGMVFKSTSAFESGTRLAVGLHLQKIRGDLGLCEHDDGLFGDRFLQLEGLVADCKIVAASPLQRFYQITLIFDNLSEGDRLLLSAVERSLREAQEAERTQVATIPGAGGLN